MDTSSPQKDCALWGSIGNVSLGLHSLNASSIPTPSLHCPFASLHLSPHATLTNLECLQTEPDAHCGQNCHQWRTTNLALCRKSCQPELKDLPRKDVCPVHFVFQTLCLEHNRGSSNQSFKGT